jgi:hypothetical protein
MANKIEEYLIQLGKPESKLLSAYEFKSGRSVQMKFPDNSELFFRYAFAINAPEFEEVGVFTEHCGYHIFPLIEDIEVLVIDEP